VAGNALSAVDSPDIQYFPGNRRMVAGPMARHRESLGLPADPDVEMPFRHLHLSFAPPAWDGTRVPRPPNTQFLRHASALVPGAELPAWLDDLPDQPTVFASLGTVFNKTPGVLEAIVEALRHEPVNLIVAIGSDEDPARFGSLPPNVRLEGYVAQPLLLPRCDCFITHAGFNSVKESLSVGVPMVAVPITADQPYSAARCGALGVARVVGPPERTAENIRSAVLEVLGEPGYATAARQFQAEMAALPGPDHMLELLHSLAVGHASVGAARA
jgi:UDP:flavonoid glycosyltransferase YjiC (YdhE family)